MKTMIVNEKPIRIMRSLFSLAVYSLSLSALLAESVGDDGISHDQAALETAFSSRFRASDGGETDSFLSRYRIGAESQTLPKFRSDPFKAMVILIR